MKKLYYSFVLLQMLLLLGVASRAYARVQDNSHEISLEILHSAHSDDQTHPTFATCDVVKPMSRAKEIFTFLIPFFETEEEEEEKLLSFKKFVEAALGFALLLQSKHFGLLLDASLNERFSNTFYNSHTEPDYIFFQVLRL